MVGVKDPTELARLLEEQDPLKVRSGQLRLYVRLCVCFAGSLLVHGCFRSMVVFVGDGARVMLQGFRIVITALLTATIPTTITATTTMTALR